MQVQTRGSVHEAFAEPVVYDPGPGPVVPTEPPQPIEEQPPDQKPEGDDIQWIAGYWSWDQDCGNCGNYIWVSGIWRLPPPGHHWVPGYWNQVNGGWQWAPGVWMTVDPADAEYLPTPPASIEAGPIGDPLAADSIWSPGCWHWTESRYAWSPGFWVAFQPNWSWVPDHYAWTPGGSLFVEGYWDYPLAQRGPLRASLFPEPGPRNTELRVFPERLHPRGDAGFLPFRPAELPPILLRRLFRREQLPGGDLPLVRVPPEPLRV